MHKPTHPGASRMAPPEGRLPLRFLAVILSVLLFVFILAVIVIYDGIQLLSENNFEELLDS